MGWPEFLLVFLGSGLGGAAVSWVKEIIIDRDNRRLEFTLAQLQHLYGPLYFFVLQNKEILKHTGKIQEGYQSLYLEPQGSNDEPQTEESSEQLNTIEMQNRYTDMVTANSKTMVELLRNQSAYIDPDDAEVFQLFVIEYLRYEVEFGPNKSSIPWRMVDHLGAVFFMRPDFATRVNEKFKAKSDALEQGRSRWAGFLDAPPQHWT